MKRDELSVTVLLWALIFMLFAPAALSAGTNNKTIELKFADWNPPQSPIAKVHQEFANKLEEESNGAVKVTMYWGEALSKTSDVYRATQLGIADICFFVVGYQAGYHDLNYFTKLPFMGWPTLAESTAIYKNLWEKFPELQKEFKGLEVISTVFMPPSQLHFTSKHVRTPEDMRGLKIIARSEWTDLLVSAKAAPMSLGIGDWYMSLEKGLADGHIVHFPAINVFNTIELLKSHMLFGNGGCASTLAVIVMNKKKYEKLSIEIQGKIKELGTWQAEESIRVDNSELERAISRAKDLNHDFVYLNTKEMESWKKFAKPVHDKWIEQTEAKGLPARAVYEEAVKQISEYQ